MQKPKHFIRRSSSFARLLWTIAAPSCVHRRYDGVAVDGLSQITYQPMELRSAHMMDLGKIDLARLTPGAELLPDGRLCYPAAIGNLHA
jgi:hypothetical protein